MKKILSALLAAAVVSTLHSAYADSSTQEYNLEISRQPLEAMLMEFSKQTGLNTSFVRKAQSQRQIIVGPLSGRYTAQAALAELLKGTELSFKQRGDLSIAVTADENSAGRKRSSGSPLAWDESSPEPRFLQLAERAFAGWQDDERQGQSQVAVGHAQVLEQSSRELEEVLVTGSRLKRSTDEGPAPVTTFDRERIDQLGATNVADVLNYTSQQPFSRSDLFGFGGARAVRLRGLGLGTTLVLINGRRTVTSAEQGRFAYFDLNSIPLSAVERIEILSDSASAVYGADAVGGVVNVILKQSTEPAIDLYYGAASDGGEERRASVSSGYSGERLRASVAVDYFDREFLLGEDRPLFADQDYRRFGSIDQRTTFSNPGNISSLTAANLPGLPSRFAAVPAGSSSIGLTPSDFLATAGQRNLAGTSKYFAVVPETRRRSGVATAEFDITGHVSAFADVLYTDRDTIRLLPPAFFAGTVPASNPFNPFSVPVSATYLFTGIGPQQDVTEAELFRGVGGLRGALGSWDWEVSVLDSVENGSSWTLNAVDAAQVSCVLTAPSSRSQSACKGITGALNIFRDGPGGDRALLDSLISDPVENNYSSDALQIGAFVRGSLFALNGESVEAVLGGENRTEKLHFEARPATIMSARRTSSAAFSEVRIPVVARSMAVPAVQGLAVTLAGRYDEYSDFGSTFNAQYGLEWNPFNRLLVRASYGTSFRPPSLFELYAPARVTSGPALDPRRNNEAVVTTLVSGGNRELSPEDADSLSVGIRVDADLGMNLMFDATYWQIEQDQRVQALSTSILLANETIFPQRITRSAPTPADLAAGRPGRLVQIDSTSTNFGSLESAGIDLNISATIGTPLGRFMPLLSATWVEKYLAQDIPGSIAADRVSIANSQGTIPRWRGTATLAWANHGIGLAMTGRYVAGYEDANTLNVRNGRQLPSQTLVDVQASFDLAQVLKDGSWVWTDGLIMRAGASNVFDEEPHFSEVTTFGMDTSQADIRQRFVYMSLTKTF